MARAVSPPGASGCITGDHTEWRDWASGDVRPLPNGDIRGWVVCIPSVLNRWGTGGICFAVGEMRCGLQIDGRSVVLGGFR